LPIVRFSRDKRGLDTIYLIDTAPEAGRRTGGARVLYFWTAPPGLRVGRTALDESAQRALQRAHPDMAFDWPALLKAVEAARAQAAALSAEPRREAWRGAGRTPRAGPRQTGRTADAPPMTVSPTAPPTDPGVETVAIGEASAVQSEGRRASGDARPVEASDPAGDGPPTSEDGAAAGRRSRRRRRRSKRSGAGDETPSTADPIIES